MKSKELAIAIIAIIALMFIIGLAGRSDYNEYVISHMKDSTYQKISKKLNTKDNEKIVEFYEKENR